MEKEIIKILESYFDNYVGLKENHRAIDINDLPEIAKEIKSALNPTSDSKRGPEEYENLRQLVHGRNINAYQKTLAVVEFENLINRYHGKGN